MRRFLFSIVSVGLMFIPMSASADGYIPPEPAEVDKKDPEPIKVLQETTGVRLQGYTKRCWYPDRDQAHQACVRDAHDQLAAILLTLDPPISIVPSVEWVREHLVKSEVPEPETQLILDSEPELYGLSLEIEMTSDQLRMLRAEQRMLRLGIIFAVITGLIGLVSLFFRLDHWSRGYLTVPLVVALLVLLGGGAVFLFGWVG